MIVRIPIAMRWIFIVSSLQLIAGMSFAAERLQFKWLNFAAMRSYSTPHVADNNRYTHQSILVAADPNGNDKLESRLVVSDKNTGRLIWSLNLGQYNKLNQTAIQPGDCPYLGVPNRDMQLLLVCMPQVQGEPLIVKQLDASTGQVSNEFRVPFKNVSQRNFDRPFGMSENGIIFMLVTDMDSYYQYPTIIAIDMFKGIYLWKQDITETIESLEIVNNAIIIQSYNQNYKYSIYKVDLGDGKILWKRLDGEYIKPFIYWEGQLLGQQYNSPTNSYEIVSFKFDDMSLMWSSFQGCTNASEKVEILQDQVFTLCIGSDKFTIRSWNPLNGVENWSQNFRDEAVTYMDYYGHESTTLVNNEVWVEIFDASSNKRMVFKFDIATGKFIKSQVI